MTDTILKFFYSTFLLLWILLGVIALTVHYGLELNNSIAPFRLSVGQLAFYLSLFAYLVERIRYKKNKNASVVLAYSFLFFWIILAAINVS
mgnify:CR=1 FL=1